MTAPIFEPSPERNDAGFAYGDQQLFRRPAPTSPVTITSFRAFALNTINTISDGGYDPCTFDVWENGDTVIFTEGLDGNGDVQTVAGNVPGLYTVTFAWSFTDSWTGNQAGQIRDLVLIYNDEGWQGDRNAITGVSSGDGMVSLTRYYPTLYGDVLGGNSLPTFSFEVGQLSGGGQDVQGRFEIIYWTPTVAVGGVISS